MVNDKTFELELHKKHRQSPAMKLFAMITTLALALALAPGARADKPHITTKDKCVGFKSPCARARS